jgi:hypothetical protein
MDLPTLAELLEAKRIMLKLRRCIDYNEIKDRCGVDAWSGLLEGERCFNVTVSVLYDKEVWDKVMESEVNARNTIS